MPIPLLADAVTNAAQCDCLGLVAGQTVEQLGIKPAVPISFPADSVITASHAVTAEASCGIDGGTAI